MILLRPRTTRTAKRLWTSRAILAHDTTMAECPLVLGLRAWAASTGEHLDGARALTVMMTHSRGLALRADGRVHKSAGPRARASKHLWRRGLDWRDSLLLERQGPRRTVCLVQELHMCQL